MREAIFDEIVRASATPTGVLNLAITKGLEATKIDQPAHKALGSVLHIAKEHFGIEYEPNTTQLKKEEGDA